MKNVTVFAQETLPDTLLTTIQRRQVGLWVSESLGDLEHDLLASFIGLPWAFVILESTNADLLSRLRTRAPSSDPLTKIRGFVQVVDDDPSKVDLPSPESA